MDEEELSFSDSLLETGLDIINQYILAALDLLCGLVVCPPGIVPLLNRGFSPSSEVQSSQGDCLSGESAS